MKHNLSGLLLSGFALNCGVGIGRMAATRPLAMSLVVLFASMAQAAPPPKITRVDQPTTLYLCGTSSLEGLIRGSGFLPGTTAKLTRVGASDVSVPVSVVFENRLHVNWPMPGLSAGVWDVVVTNPDQQSAILPGGIVINACSPFALSATSLRNSYTCGPRYFQLEGSSMRKNGATIRLTKPGEPNVVATNLIWPSPNDGSYPSWVMGYFDIGQTTAGGTWSLEFTNSVGQNATLIDAVAVVPDCPRGRAGDLYVCNRNKQNVLQFDATTGEFVCIFAQIPPGLEPSEFDPLDLVWAPNGNLWIASSSSNHDRNAVSEFDGQSGTFLGYVIPPIAGPEPHSISFGGPGGDFYVQRLLGIDQVWTERFDRASGASLGVVLYPTELPTPPGPSNLPAMRTPEKGRFAVDGSFLLTANAASLGCPPLPAIRRYGGESFAMMQEVLVECVTYTNLLQSADGASLLVANSWGRGQIDRHDSATLERLETIAGPHACNGPNGLDCVGGDPCYWGAMDLPVDLAYGPNGNLYVCADKTHVPTDSAAQNLGQCEFAMGAVHEINPLTGVQVRVIGRHPILHYPFVGADPTSLYVPSSIEFKPLPGDFGSSGSAFQGDWLINEYDLARFAAALDGSSSPLMTAANLQSFDFNRDGVIDCADWPPFAAAFQTSSGYAPILPLPSVESFVAALLNGGGSPCMSDRAGNGAVDGEDIQPFVDAMLNSTPTGACCLMTPPYCEQRTAAYCAAVHGTYRGDGMTCATAQCTGACCNPTDLSCSERSAGNCAAVGWNYQGDGTTCANGCPGGNYKNEVSPITSFVPSGTNQTLADDMTLAGTGARELSYLDLAVYGNGGGPFSVYVELYASCPWPAFPIPDAFFTWENVPDGTARLLLADAIPPGIMLPDTCWMAVYFSTPEAGWIIAEQAEIGSTADVYGTFDAAPDLCGAWFGGTPWAGFWANIACVPQGTQSVAVRAGNADQKSPDAATERFVERAGKRYRVMSQSRPIEGEVRPAPVTIDSRK